MGGSIAKTINAVKGNLIIMDTLGKRIRCLREKSGLNQSKLARELGLESPMAISKYEKDQREPDVSKLIKIGDLFGVQLDWLLTGKISAEKPSSEPQYTSFEKEYIDKLLILLRYKDPGTISAITQNIDTFLRMPAVGAKSASKKKKGGG